MATKRVKQAHPAARNHRRDPLSPAITLRTTHTAIQDRNPAAECAHGKRMGGTKRNVLYGSRIDRKHIEDMAKLIIPRKAGRAKVRPIVRETSLMVVGTRNRPSVAIVPATVSAFSSRKSSGRECQ